MYTQLCVLKSVTRVHTYIHNLESVYTRSVLLCTHPSIQKILNFVTSRHEMGSKIQKLHAYKTLKEARSLVFTAASATTAERASFQIENTVCLAN